MHLVVFECEFCKFLMKHVMSNTVRGAYSTHCPGCSKTTRFNFLREGDPIKDWYSNILIAERKRREKTVFKQDVDKNESTLDEAENVA